MPIFEYKCNGCGHTMEFLEKSRGPQKHVCAECGGTDLEKLLSGFAVGQGRSSSAACETCTTSQMAGGPCGGCAGDCPMS